MTVDFVSTADTEYNFMYVTTNQCTVTCPECCQSRSTNYSWHQIQSGLQITDSADYICGLWQQLSVWLQTTDCI